MTWDELPDLPRAGCFGIGDMAGRLKAPCPYLAALDDLQSITEKTLDRLDSFSRQG